MIASNISFYARAAMDQAWSEYEDDPPAQRRFMRSLVENEYVLVDDDGAASYPQPVAYDDWYERSVGADMSYEGYIMKSTGEKFSETEAQWLDLAVCEATWQDPDEFWYSGTERVTANRIWVHIYPVERSDYANAVKEALWQGETSQVVALLEELRCVASELDEDPSVLRRIERLFAGIAEIEAHDLRAKTWRFLASRHTSANYLVAASRAIAMRWTSV
ncbi:MAG: hypothetical protein ACLQNE_29080 [Thermoguttaceae bacterium]